MAEWSKSHGRGQRYVRVDAFQVVVGEHFGSGHTDHAGACSHAEFLAGRFQDLIRSDHGERTLAEVLAAVRGAEQDPAHARARGKVSRVVAAWEAIPVDPSLLPLLDRVDARGMDGYRRGGDPIELRHGGCVWACVQQSVRVTRGGAVLFFADPFGHNPWGLGNDVRIGDVLRSGDRVLARYSSPFSDHSPLRELIGRTGVLELTEAGIAGRATKVA